MKSLSGYMACVYGDDDTYVGDADSVVVLYEGFHMYLSIYSYCMGRASIAG